MNGYIQHVTRCVFVIVTDLLIDYLIKFLGLVDVRKLHAGIQFNVILLIGIVANTLRSYKACRLVAMNCNMHVPQHIGRKQHLHGKETSPTLWFAIANSSFTSRLFHHCNSYIITDDSCSKQRAVLACWILNTFRVPGTRDLSVLGHLSADIFLPHTLISRMSCHTTAKQYH